MAAPHVMLDANLVVQECDDVVVAAVALRLPPFGEVQPGVPLGFRGTIRLHALTQHEPLHAQQASVFTSVEELAFLVVLCPAVSVLPGAWRRRAWWSKPWPSGLRHGAGGGQQ